MTTTTAPQSTRPWLVASCITIVMLGIGLGLGWLSGGLISHGSSVVDASLDFIVVAATTMAAWKMVYAGPKRQLILAAIVSAVATTRTSNIALPWFGYAMNALWLLLLFACVTERRRLALATSVLCGGAVSVMKLVALVKALG